MSVQMKLTVVEVFLSFYLHIATSKMINIIDKMRETHMFS